MGGSSSLACHTKQDSLFLLSHSTHMALGRQAVLLVSLLFIVKTTTWVWQNAHASPSAHLLNKRSIPVDQLGIDDTDDTLLQCDAVHLHEDQCAFVLEHCQGVTPGMIDYIRWYYCASGAARPIILIVLVRVKDDDDADMYVILSTMTL